ncbi:uncharacterized protein BDW47DRAFT_124060 [Aspergillus candidus]|uniref:Uncharacterized protein n=1 Tax=Aspergillus candidus TaxID=41067 RepID=A0A2I2FHL1_ASPCN|nr:hypothetical protein BDW47DRAFT_124060 [Aspergillus candidus]PLB40127.1 hypothetical protein BDW47DRAFT_124060 [Aspergillus candidus]
MAAPRRQHVAARLQPLAATLTIETISVRSPYTLQVEKPRPEYQKHVAVRKWDAKVNEAKEYINRTGRGRSW